MTQIQLNHHQTSGVSDETLQSGVKSLENYLLEIKENSPIITLPSDEEQLAEVTAMAEKKTTTQLRYIIVVGIGGSNLGAKAVYDALPKKVHGARLIFADTVSPMLLTNILHTINDTIQEPDEFIINIISKSGGTTETIANFEIIYSALKAKFPETRERTVVTTDENSPLWMKAVELSIDCLKIPQQVGGRYSVFSAVGLFPLLLAGYDVHALRQGGNDMLEQCLQANVDNPALVSAVILHEQFKKGYVINDNFFFNPELESLGKWYRQLMAESIGKERDTHGTLINTGITPTVSIGSTDLHSMVQLYLGGPRNKLTTFVYAPQHGMDVKVPQEMFLDGMVGVHGRNAADIMDAIYAGVKTAYAEKNLPFTEIAFAQISENTLGQYMQMKMIEIMLLGKLLQVNPFDQPNVEDYKKVTREILGL